MNKKETARQILIYIIENDEVPAGKVLATIESLLDQLEQSIRERCANIVDITRKSFVLGIDPQRDHALKVAAKAIRNKK